jgi:hypothetical protein
MQTNNQQIFDLLISKLTIDHRPDFCDCEFYPKLHIRKTVCIDCKAEEIRDMRIKLLNDKSEKKYHLNTFIKLSIDFNPLTVHNDSWIYSYQYDEPKANINVSHKHDDIMNDVYIEKLWESKETTVKDIFERGKWLLFFDKNDNFINKWQELLKLYQAGKLIGVSSMKCSTSYKNKRANNDTEGIIVINCIDNSSDKETITQSGLNVMKLLNYDKEMYYKSDLQSYIGTTGTGSKMNYLYKIKPQQPDFLD